MMIILVQLDELTDEIKTHIRTLYDDVDCILSCDEVLSKFTAEEIISNYVIISDDKLLAIVSFDMEGSKVEKLVDAGKEHGFDVLVPIYKTDTTHGEVRDQDSLGSLDGFELLSAAS